MRRTLLMSVLLWTAACDDPGKLDDTLSGTVGDNGTTSAVEDADGDGFVGDDDCDDTNPAVNPGADEVCDGIDNDCDGEVDPATAVDASQWWTDQDADGYGDPTNSVTACEAPEGHADNPDDCDDTDGATSPGAAEVCDGNDNDCDGLVDDEDDSLDPSSATVWFADTDGDTFGNGAESTAACEQPDGFVADDTDCDDSTDQAYPGGSEVCDDLDNDCDGLIDDEDDSIDLSTSRTFYIDVDGDGYGTVDSITEGCSLPEGFAVEPTDCNDADAAVNPGATEVCDAADVDEDCDGLADDADADVDLSTATEWYADADADGYGSAATATTACNDPSEEGGAFVTDASDCDDTDAAINPAATEICDRLDVDEDCNGVSDDADTGVDLSTASTWYVDVDGDGYGDEASTEVVACDGSLTHTALTADDCDDTDLRINPAATEVCDAADVDEDCSGAADDADPFVDLTTTTLYYPDDDLDGYGDAGTTGDALCDDPSRPGDAWTTDDTDCNDADSAINPAATEVCDDADTDEDCDGLVDDLDGSVDTSTHTTWTVDADGDGYGSDSATGVGACDDPSDATTTYVADATDCDDAESGVNPGATEVCDADDTDEDCDGLADDADADVDLSTGSEWYVDADGDGYGNSGATPIEACEDPTDASTTYLADGSDCDDTDSAINPSATEVCDAADTDEDCDGLVDDADDSVDTSTGSSVWYADADGDGYGDAADAGTDFCDDPGSGYDTAADDCDDTDSAINPGASEVCNGLDDDCDASTTEDGLARFVETDGTETDLASTWGSGTDGSPQSWSAPDNGTLWICPDTWYVSLDFSDVIVDIEGVEGSATTILDGGDDDRVMRIDNDAEVTLTGLTVQGGSKSDGAGIYLDQGTLIASDLVLENNDASDLGGGLYATQSDVQLSDCTIDSNGADYGGGVFIDVRTTLSIDTCDVTNNVAGEWGGGIEIDEDTVLTVVDSAIEDNYAADYGGGVECNNDGTISMTDTVVSGNVAGSYYGGGLDFYNCESTFDGVLIDDNSASRGAGIYSTGSVTMTNSDVTNNTASSRGGGVYVALGSGEALTVTGGTVSGNTAGYYGGGWYVSLNGNSTATTAASATEAVTAFSSNSPADVFSSVNYYHTIGSGAAVYCDSSGC